MIQNINILHLFIYTIVRLGLVQAQAHWHKTNNLINNNSDIITMMNLEIYTENCLSSYIIIESSNSLSFFLGFKCSELKCGYIHMKPTFCLWKFSCVMEFHKVPLVYLVSSNAYFQLQKLVQILVSYFLVFSGCMILMRFLFWFLL